MGAFLFFPETMDLFPNAPTLVDSLKADFGNAQDSTIQQVNKIDKTIDDSIVSVNNKVDELKETSQDVLSNTAATANSTISKVFPFG